MAGASVLAAAAVLGAPAEAGVAAMEGAAAACSLVAESITATGTDAGSVITATTPPSKRATGTTPGIFEPGQVRLATTFIHEPNIAGVDVSGWVVQGDGLYRSFYSTNEPEQKTLVRIGGGWTNYTALEVSQYADENFSVYRQTAYGLRSDGTLYRWNIGASWHLTGSATGFGAVKSMALVSKTPTYDTFLANLRGGSLYTIRIPTTAPMKPIVKQIRAGTWQGFEKLTATKCGQNSTLLLGIDKDTNSGYLYAVGHANGTATVIQSRGKVNGTFPDAVNFRWGVVADLDPLKGD
ncbi:hypothetical protein [Kribbella capetownensis]|nr:hypothetical protein [Kribbella capetownensis]